MPTGKGVFLQTHAPRDLTASVTTGDLRISGPRTHDAHGDPFGVGHAERGDAA